MSQLSDTPKVLLSFRLSLNNLTSPLPTVPFILTANEILSKKIYIFEIPDLSPSIALCLSMNKR